MTVPVVFASDDYYLPYVSAMIQSIMENAGLDNEYRVYILYRNISAGNRALLEKQVEAYPRFSLGFINVSEHIAKYTIPVNCNLTIETYFRFFMPYLLAEYDKILYFDGDMICNCDVAELYSVDLKGNTLGAARDTGHLRYYYSSRQNKDDKIFYDVMLNLKNPTDYFNAGMLVWDIKQFRNLISMDDLFNLILSRKWHFNDQDILNYLCHEKTLLLPFDWNCMCLDDGMGSGTHLSEDFQNKYNEAKQKPKIIHYKPYKYWYYCFYAHTFWKYATRTPFVDIIIERMVEKKLIIFSDMDNATLEAVRNGRILGRTIVKCAFVWLSKKLKRGK
jgi:lipopolysaccharide biosynthesis glycosyltransferase